MESARQLSKHLRLFVYVSSATLLSLHAVGGTRLVEGLSPDSFLPVISYLPALPVTIMTAILMIIFAHKNSLRLAAVALALMHYLVCGDYSGRSIVSRIEIEQKAVASAVNSQVNMPLRIAAANVQYLHQGPTKVGSMLEQLNVDVWLLSEFETTKEQEAKFLAEMPGYRLVVGKMRDVAVVTRLPVLSWTEVSLPSRQTSLRARNSFAMQEQNEHRSFLHLVLESPNGPVNVLPIRFTAGRPPSDDPRDQWAWGRYLLREQAREVDVFSTFVSQLSGPVIFGGDLNATHGSSIVRKLRGIGRDVYLEKNLFGDYTFRTFTPWLPPVPTMRLDYLFVKGTAKIVRAWRDLAEFSDHYPIIGEFYIGG